MSGKYEKFDNNEFGLLPSEHQNVDVSKPSRNGSLKLGPSSSSSSSPPKPVFAVDPTETCAVEIITGNGSLKSKPVESTVDLESGVAGVDKLDAQSSPSSSASPATNSFSSPHQLSYIEFPEHLDQLTPTQKRLRHYLEHVVFRLVSMLLILVDCTLLIADLAKPFKHDIEQDRYDLAAFLFALYFCVEIMLRIYARGLSNFFSDWYNSVDCVIIVLSMAVTLAYTAIDISGSIKLVALGRLIRVCVLIRLLRPVYTEPRNVQRGMRNVVSENKRRMKIGKFDLDLTYIQPHIIAMSFPSSGRMAWYRNCIRDVATYLDERHGTGRYRVYNLCSEKAYDALPFHGQVRRFEIDDHNVPTLQQMLDFVKDAQEFLAQSDQHVVAIHCKGGKGRTGTMICALMLYLDIAKNADQALSMFSDRRTDLSMASKYQGVETPSQGRYVQYFGKLLADSRSQLNSVDISPASSVFLPARKQLQLQQLRLVALIGVGAGDGSDLSCKLDVDRTEQFQMDFGTRLNCDAQYNGEQDALIVTPHNCPTLVGDVRLRFYSRSKKVPKGYEQCSFYFWFNTAMLESSTSLRLTRTQLDNPHKATTWKIFRERFAVELTFRDDSSA